VPKGREPELGKVPLLYLGINLVTEPASIMFLKTPTFIFNSAQFLNIYIKNIAQIFIF
jgi:hypothetical protein